MRQNKHLLLLQIARQPEGYVDISEITYNEYSLEVKDLVRSLTDKGFIQTELMAFNPDIVTLTEKGRKKALNERAKLRNSENNV